MSEDGNRSSALPKLPPDSRNIWRYIDFTQLISILERESLWFNRADLFEDPLEGSYSRATVNTRKERYQHPELPDEKVGKLIQQQSESARVYRKSAYLNCWHMSPRESMAMWELYSIEGQGIAIQSNVGRMKKALRAEGGYINREDTPVPEEAPRINIFTLGAVRYIDYDRGIIPEGNLYSPLFHKRLSFEHEKEFRVATSRFFDYLADDELHRIPDDLDPGEYIDIGLEELIEKIYVSPSSADWFLEQVEMVADRYGVGSEKVVRSSLDEDPVF